MISADVRGIFMMIARAVRPVSEREAVGRTDSAAIRLALPLDVAALGKLPQCLEEAAKDSRG